MAWVEFGCAKVHFLKDFAPITGSATATRLLLHLYVTIFGTFKAKSKKKILEDLEGKFTRFLPP